MANPDHLAKLKEGKDAWNRWRKENPDVKPDLREAELPKAPLVSFDLSGANLRGANLSGAELGITNLSGAVLRMADLSQADLRGVRGLQLDDNDVRESRLSFCCRSMIVIRAVSGYNGSRFEGVDGSLAGG